MLCYGRLKPRLSPVSPSYTNSRFLDTLFSSHIVEYSIVQSVSTVQYCFLFRFARSLLKNLDQLNLMLGSLKKPFSVIGISETWLTDCTAELINITGYNFVSNHRKFKTGGGVGIYLQNDLQYKLLNECKLADPETIESSIVEITIPHGKNIIVGRVYRPPNQNTALLLYKFNDILSRISKNKQCYVMGDLNLDFLQYHHHTPTQDFSTLYFRTHLFLSSPIQRASPLILQP